jgi:hypothetical protein
VNNPVPSIATLAPASVVVGAASQTLTINGSNFVPTSTVTYNAVAHAATFVSSSQLTITLSAADQATAGSYAVVVTNPAPGGGASVAVNFTVSATNPVPAISTFAPASLTAGAASQTLTINGTGFLTTSTVTYNAVAHTASYVSASQLTISLSAADLASAGNYAVVVTNPAPGGGASTAVNFTVNNAVPSIATLSPASAVAGAAAQTLTINGSNFVPTSTVTYNAVAHAATFVNSSKLTIALSAADQATAGSYAVVVTNPAPGGGASSAVNFTVNNPVPSIATLAPASVVVGAASQTLTINGSNFVPTSTVIYNAVAHAATFVSSSQLTITLSAADQATAGSYAVVVTNPAPGGGASVAVNFTVSATNPVPAITTFAPASLTAGAASQTLTINGTGFLTSSTVSYNAVAHTASYVSASQLTISLSAADLAAAGNFPVVVTNPAPGGGSSAAVNFTVNNAVPSIATLSPASAVAGAAAQTLTINGSNFVPTSTASYNGVAHAATYVSASQLTIALSAADQAAGGSYPVVVTNPAPGGGPSAAVSFTVNNPVPNIATLSPAAVVAGAAAQTLTINGGNFVPNSTVTFNAVSHAATFVSSSQLTITLSAADQATGGSYPVVVTNPAPGGGISAASTFTVNNPAPSIATLSPASAAAGAASQTLTINGANFVPTSTVSYNAVSHAAMFVSSSQLTITLSAADQAAQGSYTVVVTNPVPGGGVSNAVSFAVGTPTTLSTTIMDFGSVTANTTSAAKSVTLTNNQAVALNLSSIAAAAPFAVVSAGSICVVGTPVPALGSCTINVTFTPTSIGAAPSGNLVIADDAINSPQNVVLSGSGAAAAATTLSASSLSFGNVAVGSISAIQSVSLSNNQTTSLTIGTLGLAGAGYALDPSSTCVNGGTVAASGNCTIALTFTPALLGVQAGMLTITSNAPNSPLSVSLSGSGTGIAPTTLSTTAINFGNVVVNAASAVKTVTLTNKQTTSLSLASLAVSGTGYALDPSTTCPSLGALASGASCTMGLTLTPGSVGAQPAGTLTITDNAGNSPQTVALSGMGIAATTLSATGISFGSVTVNTTSAIKTVTLTNNQSIALGIATLAATGTGYALDPSTTCSTTSNVAAGGSCTLALTYTPTLLGAQTGTLTIITNAANSPQTVALSGAGAGIAPTTLSVASLDFGNVVSGTSSAIKTVTLTNNQTVALNIASLAAGSPYAIDPSTTCGNPGALASGANCTIALTMTPASIGAQAAGTLTITDDAANTPQTVSLGGTGIAPTTVSPSTLNFGTVAQGSTSAIKTITLTNNQLVALGISSLGVTGSGYALDATTVCPNTGNLAAGASCAIALTYTPTAQGAQSGQLTITTNASNSPQTVSLSGSGSGTSPTTLTPVSVNFGNVGVSLTSAVNTVSLTNNQASALNISSLAITSGTPYAINPSSTCLNPTLAAGASCSIALTMTPASLGAQPAASLTVTTNAPNSPQNVTLAGTGVAQSVLSPTSLSFGSVPINTTSAPLTVTLTNYTAGNLTVGPVIFNGPFVLDTGASTTCPVSGGAVSGTLAAGAGCAIGIDFKPTSLGATPNGQITVVSNANNSPIQATLAGTGVLPVGVAPATVAFGNVAVNTASAAQSVTVTNNQTGKLNFSSISATAPYAVVPAGTTCVVGTPVAAGGSCIVNMTFTPTSAGAAAANVLTINDDAPGTPQTVSLTGSGVLAVTLNPAALSFGTVVVNQATVKTATLTNNQAVPLTIASVNGFPSGYALNSAGTTCPFAPATVAAGANCTIAVSLTATATGAQNGSFNINDDAPSSPQAVNVTASAVQPVVLSPTSLTFAAQYQGTTSTAQTVTLTNEQTVPLHISGASITGTNSSDFAVSSSCPTAPTPLAANTGCSLALTFTPIGSGTRTATLNIADDAVGSPQTVALTGSGNAPVTIVPVSITNYTAPVGTTSAYQTITITNSSTAPLHLSNFQLNGEFVQTSTTCAMSPAALAVGANCNLTVSFNPTIGGVRGGQLQIYDDANTSPQAVNLSGTGTSPLTISTSALIYSAQKIGSPSPAQNITLTNHESKAESFTLTPSGDFTATSNCPSGAIAQNSSCVVSVFFVPSAAGPRSGSLNIAHTAAIGSPLGVSLTGSGSTTNPPAAVAVVSPGAGGAGKTVNVVITGNGWTNFSSSSSISFVDTDDATIAPAITVASFTAVTANQINAQLVIDPAAIYGARNIQVQTPLTGGGTETALLNSAFIVEDPTDAHVIANVSPNLGIQGQTLSVEITGTNTSFVQGTTFANFGDGITINNLIINTPTDAVANITISNTTPVGYRTITLVTGGEYDVSSTQAFQILPNSAALLSVSPNTAPQGGSLPINLIASGTHFLQDATRVSISGGVIVGNVAVTSPTTATAELAVTQGATIGVQDVTVWTGGEIATLASAFTITGATPGLLSVTPSAAQQGQTLNVVITGNAYTTFNVGSLLADFTGVIAVNSTTANSAHQVTVNITISPNAPAGGLTARLTNAGTIFPFTFTVLPSNAQITSVSPACVPQGGQMTLTLTALNTNWVQGTTNAAFYPIPVGGIQVNEVTIADATDASLAVSVQTNTPAGTYGFYVATGGQVVSSAIGVCAATPTLSVSPANGLAPTGATINSYSVSFTGQFTHFSQTATLPVVGGEGVMLTNFTVNGPFSATGTLSIDSTAVLGPRLITFTTGGEIVTTYFNVTAIPVGIVYLSPNNAPQSETLDVEIVGLNTHFTAGTTQVLFGPLITVNSVTVNNPTDLVANISTSNTVSGSLTATPPGWQTVYVNTGSEQVLGGFLVDAPASPRILSVAPSSGAQGATEDVTIVGSLTHWVNGQTNPILGAGVTITKFNVTSPTTATATISVSPTAPVGGNSVIFITGTEVDSGAGFNVTPSAAEIVSVTPAATCNANGGFNSLEYCGVSNGAGTPYVISQLQTASLNIVGVGTHWLQGETTLSFGPGVVVDQLTINSTTTATVQITVLSSSPVGYAALTSFTDGETVTLQQAIDIEQGFPTLLAITPTGAEQGATLNLQVLGRFTNWQQGATTAAFNQDIAVNSVTVIDSDNLIANITVSPLAYVDYSVPCGHVITITTGTVQETGTAGIFCVAQGAAQLTGVTPNSGEQGSTESVTVTGSATHFVNGETTAYFGPGINVGTVTVTSPTSANISIAVTTAAPTGFTNVTLTTLGEVATQQFAFTVSPGVATLNEAIPNQAEQGAPLSGQPPLVVRLIGQYSHFNAQSTATFGTGITVQSVAYVSPTEVDATIVIDPISYTGTRLVTVTSPGVPCSVQPNTVTHKGVHALAVYEGCTPGSKTGTGSEIVTDNAFTIVPGPAIISQVAPATGNEGQEVVFNITGSGTHWAQNFTQFYIAGGGYDLTINSVVINSATSATVDLSISPTANPGARSIYMITAGESLTDSGAFVVTGGVPVITYLSPNNALQGTSGLEVTINGLYTHWTQAATTVNFGPGVSVVTYQVDDETHIEAVVNVDPAAQPGYRTVFVQTGTQGLTGNFLVTAPAPPPTPYIAYFWPSSGLPGQTFTVTFIGNYTHWNPDPVTGTQATFGSGIAVNTFHVTSPTSAIANITITATGAQSNLFVLTTPLAGGGTETEDVGFNVVVSVPVLSVVDPGSGMQGAQNLTVNIMGQFTTFDNTTTFQFGNGITVNGPPTILGPTIATQSISINQLAPLGYSGVTALTPDATGTAQSVGGAGFTVNPSLALISSISPNTALQGSTIQVEVTGQNTHWDALTTFQFGAGIVVTSTVVNSNTDATLILVLPALASEGPTWATAHTLGEVANINNGFVVQPGTPLLLSSGPGSAPQQGEVVFTILSQATQWTTNPPTVSYGAGIVLTNTIVTGDTSLTVDGYVQPTTAVGYRNLTVATGSQVLGLSYAVYVSPGPAVINSIVPATAGQGATLSVTINGINTNWQQGVTTLNFPDVLINSYTVNSPTSITANITVSDYAPAGQVAVTATTLGEVANENNAFTFTQTQPELLAVVSSSGAQGLTETVNLTGQFTHFVAGTSTVSFGAGITVNSINVTTATTLQANITVQPTAAVGYRDVSVTTNSEVVGLSNGFQVTTGPAAIVLLSPAAGGQGNSVTMQVTGSQSHFASGVTTATFGGGIQVTGITVTDALHATVTVSIPNYVSLGNYNVTLNTGGEAASILGGFTVTTGSPQLSSVSPPTGNQGATSLSVNLTGLFTHWVNGSSTAGFGAGITVGPLTVTDATDAVATITISPTATLGSRTVTVTTGAETASITGGFTVLAGIPALVSTSPGTAQAGSTANIVVTGAFSTFQQGFSTVSFGPGVTVNFVTVSSITQLTANISVASNASVGSRTVSVTTNSQTLTLNNGFTVTAGTPVVTQISPNIGTPGATVTVNIGGQYTNWINGTTTVSFGPEIGVGGAAVGVSGPVTVNNATSLTATLTIPSGAAVGPQDVIVTTGSEIENVPAGFTIQPATIPAPTVISLSPGPSSGGIPINSNFVAVFSQPMDRTTITTSTVTLTLTSNPNGSLSVPGTVTLDATGRVMTFTPNALLAVNSSYNFRMTNAIKDATGNTLNYYSVSLSTGYAANTAPPTVLAVNPQWGSTGVGTNVAVQVQFSTDMNQATQSGFTVSSGGVSVPGSISWNSNANCCGTGWGGPGTILTFTPTAPLAANTVFLVALGAPLADTAGNALAPVSFTFTTTSGADTATNNAVNLNFANNETNVGTNFAPTVVFAKPINPLDLNTGTLYVYNGDSGKYVGGTVSVSPSALSATFTPSLPLLPDTYYVFHLSGGYYDMDGNYLNGANWAFTTGAGQDLAPPTVAGIDPANGSVAVPLNAQIVVHFSQAIDPTSNYSITVVPTGGSAIAGTTTLGSDLVTLTFVPTTALAPATTFTVMVQGYNDLVGNAGAAFSSTFTSVTSIAPINVSTGLDASGNRITSNNTADAHWVVVPLSSEPSESTFGSPSSGAAQPLLTVGPGDSGWYSGWAANGPTSDWIAINPNSTSGNTYGLYYTTFNIPGSSVPANLCLVGSMGVDDNGVLAINGNAIMGNVSAYGSLYALNIPISSYLVTGANTLSLGWGGTDNYDEAFRLGAVIESCGASLVSGLSLTGATPANGAQGVSTNTTIALTFNNVLDPATVNSTTLPVMVNWNSSQEIAGTYVVAGNTVTFTPDTPFPVNTQIYVGACNGPLDMAGESAGGCYTQLTSFTTASTAAPVTPAPPPFQVAAFTPAANATNVGLRAPVTATFNRSVNLSTVNSSDAGLFSGDSQSPWCTSYSHSQDGASFSFNCYALPASDTLTAILNSGLQDWSGNALVNFTSQFTTAQYDSNTNGTVISTRPGNGASGVNANMPIVLFTSLPINSASANNGIQVAQNNIAVPGTVQVLDAGYTLQFTPSSPFTAGALIQWWTTGSLTDSTYNTPINTTSGYFYIAASTSTLAPAVQVASPATYTNPVPLNTIFDIQFNTPLNPATITASNIYLYDSTTGLHPAATLTQPQPNEVRLTPTANLPANHYIDVYVTTGLQSTTSVPATSTSWWEYTGTAADPTLPVITSAVPMNGATGIGVNVQPGVIFNKAIDPVSVNSTTFQVLNGATPLAGSYWFSSNDTRVEFVPNAPLPANSVLTMMLNGVTDQVGNPITYSSTFTTAAGPDFTAPTVLYTSVASNESIPINSAISVQFSEPMDATSFGVNNLRIYDSLLGANIAATVTWNAVQTVAYIVPNTPLAAGREYYFYVNGGTDLAGNQMNGIEITFYAAFNSASTAPTVINFNPLNGATGLGTNAVVEAQFSAPIDPNSVSQVTLFGGGSPVQTTPSLSAGNTVLQLVPQVPLAANTIYTFSIVGVKDPAGNAVASTSTTFTTSSTYDISSPSAINSDPVNNTTVGTNVTLKLIFNKPLNPITVSNSTFRMYLYDTGQWIPLTLMPSANGMEVDMQPQVPLLPNTRYYFQACCGYQDQDGNNGNSVTIYFWTNGGAVTAAPTFTISPQNGAVAIPLGAQVILSFNAPIDPMSWTQNSIELLNGATPVAGTVAQPSSQTLTFTPASALAASTIYTVQVSGIADSNGNAVASTATTFTTATTASASGLTFTGSNIVNNSTVTSYTQPIILSFSQILDPTTVNSSTLRVMNGWNSNFGLAGTYTVSGNQVTFTPANPYPAGATIYVGECGGPTDVLGEVFQNGSCWSQQLLYFNTPSGTSDTTPLTVISVGPASGAINVRPDVSVSVTFNKSINPYTVYNNSNNALLFAGQSLQDRGSITMSADDRTLTFNVGTLSVGATYTIDLPAGGIADPSGNALASTFTSSFTVGVNPATGNSSVQSTAPGNNATGVPTDTLLTLYLTRPVQVSTLTGNLSVTVNGQVYAGTVQAAAGGYEAQFTPTVPFPNGATVQWFFSGNVLDIYGNPFNGASGYFYTAAAVNPATAQPTVIAISPRNGSSAMPTNGEIDILYSLPIDPTTVTSSNVYFNNGLAETIAMPAPNLIRVTPASGSFSASTNYYFCANSSVKGTNGVATPGNCWATYFTTTSGPDSSNGTVIVGPPNGSTSVGTNAYIRLQFSKPVDLTSINTTTVQVSSGGNPIPGTWSYNYSGNDVIGANFSPVNPLPPSSTIQVNVNGLLDYVGNSFTAASSSFTTAAAPDYTTPTVSLDFGGNTSGIGTNASFTCLYSEAMDPSSVTTSNTYLYSYVTNAHVPVTYTWAADLMAVTMTPTAPLLANSEYNYYCNGAIDLTGNGQNGASSYFYTGSGPSSAGPILIQANPPNGFTNVPLNTNSGPWNSSSLQLLFNEPVATESLANITLTPAGGSPMPIAVYPEYGNTIASVALPWSLAPNTTYTYNIAGVTDFSGNPSASTTSSFTTGSSFDWTSPTATAATPANGTTSGDNNPTISLTFNEAMDPVIITSSQIYLRTHNTQTTIPTTLSISPDFTTVTVTPTTPLAGATIYDLVYWPNNWWLTDIAGNNTSNYGVMSTFTTGPAAVVNGACGSANGGSFVTPPTANLCSAGTASALTNPGSWTWSCNGLNGGATASCSATVTPAGPPITQPSGLVSWWPGNDNANDIIGGNNGTLENGATFALGEVDDAFSLNGSNQYVLIGQPVPANLQIQNAITLSAWIYPTAYPTDNGSGAIGIIVGSQHDGNYAGATLYYDARVNPDSVNGAPIGHIGFNIGDGSNWHVQDTLTQVPLNQWTLVTATATAGGSGQIYYNGVLQPSSSGQYPATWSGTVSYSGSWFAIGQEVNENRPFTGLIDEVQVYNVALTAAQIRAIYNAGSAGMNPVTPAAINGVCGSANGQSLATAPPAANLCSAGAASALSSSSTSTWSWSCAGLYGGTTSSACSANISGVAVPNNLLAWWNFDEGSGTVAHDIVGGVNGTLQGSAAFTSGGVEGGAVSISGAGSLINMGDNFNFNNSSAYSLQVWVKLAAGDTGGYIPVSRHNSGVAQGYLIAIGNISSGCSWAAGSAYLYSEYPCSPNSTLLVNDGKWHQIVGTFQSGVASIYVDGTYQGSSSGTTLNPLNGYPFLVGGINSSGAPENTFSGLIDDVGIWNVALTPAQVTALY